MTLKDGESKVGRQREGAAILVTISLAWKMAKLTELAQLELQQILSPDAPFNGGVVVGIEGRPVARGDLVKLDGQLAVRIDSLYGVDTHE